MDALDDGGAEDPSRHGRAPLGAKVEGEEQAPARAVEVVSAGTHADQEEGQAVKEPRQRQDVAGLGDPEHHPPPGTGGEVDAPDHVRPRRDLAQVALQEGDLVRIRREDVAERQQECVHLPVPDHLSLEDVRNAPRCDVVLAQVEDSVSSSGCRRHRVGRVVDVAHSTNRTSARG